jgi:hypothetical protein
VVSYSPPRSLAAALWWQSFPSDATTTYCWLLLEAATALAMLQLLLMQFSPKMD